MRLVPLSRADMEARAGHHPSRKLLDRLGLVVALRNSQLAAESGRLGATGRATVRRTGRLWLTNE